MSVFERATVKAEKAEKQALIVDDDPGLLGALARTFKLEGFEVRTAGNGREALELLIANPDFQPVVILSDHDMPLMTGSEFYRQLRQTFPELEPRFIMMSGSVKPKGFCESRSIPFLDKPFDTQALNAAIKLVLP